MNVESPTLRKDAVVVLGMHRSGTSAMTRVLSLAGARLPSRLMPEGFGNATGHWEPTDVQEFNDQILGELKSSWDDIFGPRRNKQGKLPTSGYIPRARDIIRENWDGSTFIVLKEPRVSLLLDVWRPALAQEGYRTSFVVMVRHPVEVAASLKSRNRLIKNRSLMLWGTYMLSAEIGTRDSPRMFVTFDELLRDPAIVLDRVESDLDIILPGRNLVAEIEIEEFVSEDERHYRSRNSATLRSFGPVERYFQYLEAAASGSNWNVDCSKELLDWLGSLEGSIGPILKQLELERHGAQQQAVLANQRAEAARAAFEAELAAAKAAAGADAAAEAEVRAHLESLASDYEAVRRQADEADAKLAAVQAERAAREAELTGRASLAESEAILANQRAEAAEVVRAASEAELSDAIRRQGAETEATMAAVGVERAEREAVLADRANQAESEAILANQRAEAAETEAAMAAAGVERAEREAVLADRANQAEIEAILANQRAEAAEAARASSEAELRAQELQRELEDAVAALEDSSQSRDALTAEVRELRARQEELRALRDQSAQLARSLSEAVSSRRAFDRLSAGQLLLEAIRRLTRFL